MSIESSLGDTKRHAFPEKDAKQCKYMYMYNNTPTPAPKNGA